MAIAEAERELETARRLVKTLEETIESLRGKPEFILIRAEGRAHLVGARRLVAKLEDNLETFRAQLAAGHPRPD